MKNVHFIMILAIMLVSCKKEGSVDGKIESAKQDSAVIRATDNPEAIRVEPIKAIPGLGKVVFTNGTSSIITFDTQANTGTIKLNGKEYPLDQLTFSENNYDISGGPVQITAENGNFQEMISDCNYGVFPVITVRLNNEQVKIENVKVQDCPNYN